MLTWNRVTAALAAIALIFLMADAARADGHDHGTCHTDARGTHCQSADGKSGSFQPAETWCGVRVAPEQACPSYSGRNWPYAADLDVRHAEAVGGYFAPYTRRVFDHAGQVDIEHIVPRHEAAKSGACGWPRERKREFANDALEITIAGPMVNRRLKSDRDPSEWMPEYGKEWYAARWVRIKRKYDLAADPAEVAALDAALGGRCP